MDKCENCGAVQDIKLLPETEEYLLRVCKEQEAKWARQRVKKQ